MAAVGQRPGRRAADPLDRRQLWPYLHWTMALLPIITAPDPRLKKVCAPVEAVDDGIRRLMDDMLETMYNAHGIGLAAPQVGVLKRAIVIDIAGADGDKRHTSDFQSLMSLTYAILRLKK